MIAVNDITLVAGNQAIFTDLSIEFTAKGISFLMGANGAGKTQLLRLIHGLSKANSGKISAPEKHQQVFLAQTPILLSRSVLDNLTFMRGRQSCSNQHFDKNLDKIIAYFGLKELLNQQVMTLSGGQKKRVATARLFLQQAQLYLIDEPSANVDYKTNLLIESAMSQLVSEGKKIILASHDWLQIERLFVPNRDELLLLQEGKLRLSSKELDIEPVKSYW